MSESENIPYGYCQCGCGGKTRLAPMTSRSKGWVKGEPLRFIRPHRSSKSPKELLWDRVEVGGPDDCWPCSGFRQVGGYVTVTVAGKSVGAHRLSLELALGQKIPKGKFVCHKCDNPPCVNPAHLFVGDPAANSADMTRKGRSLRGEKNPDARLTEERVKYIRSLDAGYNPSALAARFGVAESTIRCARSGSTWKWLD